MKGVGHGPARGAEPEWQKKIYAPLEGRLQRRLKGRLRGQRTKGEERWQLMMKRAAYHVPAVDGNPPGGRLAVGD